MGRDNCHACLLLEEYYRLKVNDYVLVAAAAPWSPLVGPIPISDDLCRARSLTLEAARLSSSIGQSAKNLDAQKSPNDLRIRPAATIAL